MEVPVTVKLATVGRSAEQNDCEDDPVGAAGVGLTITVTSNLNILSQPNVCVA